MNDDARNHEREEVVYVFPQDFRHAEFTFITVDIGELIFSG
jgi:hypothetical protein